MELAAARELLDADFRPPCRRGDIDAIDTPAIVAIVDGVFEQSLAISPSEVLRAIQRGIYVCGGASMGALRAAEVPQMLGIGRVYVMYRDGLIDGDDEVALLFDPDRMVPLTVPLVNVRFAVERLVFSGTIDVEAGQRVLTMAQSLHFKERTYGRILRELGITGGEKMAEWLALLQAHDVKRADAVRVLEHAAEIAAGAVTPTGDVGRAPPASSAQPETRNEPGPNADIFIWETGDRVGCEQLLDFVIVTNRFSRYASRILCRLLLNNVLADLSVSVPPVLATRREARECYRTWGWRTPEEARITLGDLGLSLRDVLGGLRTDAIIAGSFDALMQPPRDRLLQAFRVELFLNDLALKRETLVLASILHMGGARRHSDADLRWAQSLLCRLHNTPVWRVVEQRILSQGVAPPVLESAVVLLASAHAASVKQVGGAPIRSNLAQSEQQLDVPASLKPDGDDRFALAIDAALVHATRIERVIGVTRVGFVEALTDIPGVFVSQVARPGGAWSSSYGSGKSTTRGGALVGGVMEEAEKWANEQFTGEPMSASYEDLIRSGEHAIDPATLDLPYDSAYLPARVIAWQKCLDLIGGGEILVPLAAVACHFNAGRNNPFYSHRAGRAVFSTNGLASGFSLAEALVHATCESIERHNTKVVEVQVENPGLDHPIMPPRGIDTDSAPADVRELVEELRLQAYAPFLFDISVDVRVPTVAARVIRDGVIYAGWGAHPNPTVAARAALLEACQTVATMTAGGREDLTLHARSLGRHERPRPNRDAAFVSWNTWHDDRIALGDMAGFHTPDIAEEFRWVRARLVDAGIEHLLVVDMTRHELLPARVVRVVIPGLDTTNPFRCGPRLRRVLAAEILSR